MTTDLSLLPQEHQALLACTYLFSKSNLEIIPSFFSSEIAEGMRSVIQEWAQCPEEELTKKLTAKLKEQKFPKEVPLHIHPDWIAEALYYETPRMVAAILRHWPAHMVEAVLKRLPASLLEKLPPLGQTFSMSPKLAGIIRKKFEASFVRPQASWAEEGCFESLCLFDEARLRKIFRELGFRELALALTGLTDSAAEIIMGRLPQADVNYLRERLLTEAHVGALRSKQAQSNLLSMDLEKTSSENFILGAGFFVYSKALTPDHKDCAQVIEQKFSKSQAAILSRFVAKNLSINTSVSVLKYQAEILNLALGYHF